MKPLIASARRWAKKGAELVAVILMTAMFSFFLLQIFTRYILNAPLSWTSEASTITYIWVIFWGSAFLLRNDEHVRFSILHDAARPHVRRLYSLLALIFVGAAFAAGLPGIWDYVSFMKIEKSPILGIRFDYLFSIFMVFAVVVVLRNLTAIISLVRKGADRSKS